MNRRPARHTLITAGFLSAFLGLALTACASTAEVTDSEGASSDTLCGMGTGEPATEEPVKLGALSLDLPGLTYTEAADSANAYFDCVNANGGINGRPIDYTVYTDGLDPAQSNSLTLQLIDEDGVLGIVGGLNAMDCLANNDVYIDKDYYVIGIASAPQCFGVSNYSPLNLAGPTLLPAAQLAVDEGATKVVTVLNAAPGVELTATMVNEWTDTMDVDLSTCRV